jgi:hypothetical protein
MGESKSNHHHLRHIPHTNILKGIWRPKKLLFASRLGVAMDFFFGEGVGRMHRTKGVNVENLLAGRAH